MLGAGNTKFARPVMIRLARNSKDQIVVDASQAGRILMRDWPGTHTVRRQVAMDACLRVLRGEASPPIARGAFVAAALEAHILASD
jgi:Protein of unknown function (DUF982)